MPLDAICLSGLAKELQDRIDGGRIDKIQQPARDLLIVSLRAKGENLKLLFSVGTGNARVHLTKASFENPSEAPMFCMLMRKHLVGARICRVSQIENERILLIDLLCRDELGIETNKKLIAELIGRSSNLILADAEGRIIDCMRRMDFGGDALRRMLPGMLYRLPPAQSKAALLEISEQQRQEMISNADKDVELEKWLLQSFSGLSPLVCRELSYRCSGDYEALPELLSAFCDSVRAGEVYPYLISEDGKPIDISFMRIKQYADRAQCEQCESFSELLDCFWSRRDRIEQQRRRAHELEKTLRTLRDRQQRKLASQAEELKRTQERDKVRKNAELITANIYRLKKGDRKLECLDYYSEEQNMISIELDPLKSPQQNAAALFKEYNKLKAAREHLTKMISEGEQKLDYLNSVLELVRAAESEKDLSELRRELVSTGYIKQAKSHKPDKSKPQTPLRFVTDDGFEILVGRSNIQNDELSFKIGRRTDIWFHTQKLHGSHAVLCCQGERPPQRSIEQAAIIAAYYSQGRGAGKIPVDYTMLRNVRKPSSALPGKVIYTDYNTILAQADETMVFRLIKK